MRELYFEMGWGGGYEEGRGGKKVGGAQREGEEGVRKGERKREEKRWRTHCKRRKRKKKEKLSPGSPSSMKCDSFMRNKRAAEGERREL